MHTEQTRWQTASFEELGTRELYTILQLRQQVFGLEQGCLYQDMDNLDLQALHIAAWEGNQLLAYLRALPSGASFSESSLGRIVVAHKARGHGLGREIVRRGIELNLSTWPDAGICISAQAHLEAFYRSLGFDTASDIYDEDGIPHIKMRLREDARRTSD